MRYIDIDDDLVSFLDTLSILWNIVVLPSWMHEIHSKEESSLNFNCKETSYFYSAILRFC